MDDDPIPYMQRTRDYYAALGYPEPYRWARFADVPFQPLQKPLADCRVALITTAAQGNHRSQYEAEAKFYRLSSLDASRDHELCISHVAIDFDHTTGEDPGTYFPLRELRRAASRGRIGLGRFVEIDRDRELAAHPLRQAAGVRRGLLQGDPRHRHQRAD